MIQLVTDEEYGLMISCAMALDRRTFPKVEAPRDENGGDEGDRPGDYYNARATWRDVLEPAGWLLLYQRGGLSYWKRPGKSEPGHGATTGVRTDCGKDLLYVFTTSTGLQAERSYDKFGAYTALNHGGDWSAAGKALLAEGYGSPSRPAGKVRKNGQANGYSRPEEVKPPAEKNDQPVLYTLPELLSLEIPETVWTVPGLLSEGLTLLAGKPKLGKSMLALNLAITVAAGGLAMGTLQTTAGDVLYLSLEDRLRRVRFRAEKMLTRLGVAASERLQIAVTWPRQGDGGLCLVEEWMKGVPAPRLVIVDVWQKFRPALLAGSQYEQDYNHAAALKDKGDKYGCSILALHHCKKAKADDVVDEISGTLGLAGAADGLAVLTRTRSEMEAHLFVSGRDTEERTLAIEFDPHGFVWKHVGEAAERTESQLKSSVMELFRANVGSVIANGEIADRLGLKDQKREYLRLVLLRMNGEGLIEKAGVGRWRWPARRPGEESATGV